MSKIITLKENSYALLDCGRGMKLERFGKYILARPDPEALWERSLSEEEWSHASATYVRSGVNGVWKKEKNFPSSWNIEYGGLVFELRPTSFKHVGIFPEQKSHWEWLENKIKNSKSSQPIRVLNLFAYTGGATLSALKAGAEVTHVDSSSVAISWAKKNAELSGLSDKPIRWIEEDVLVYLSREIKRGSLYDVVIMDPPAFGHGSGKKLWKIERDFYELFSLVEKVLSKDPLAVIVNGYTAGYSPITFENNLKKFVKNFGGEIESGELVIEEEGGRLLPSGVFSRWSKK